MKIKIFWKKDCPNCPQAKNIGRLLEDKVEVQYCDIDTVDGLTEACMLNVMSTPTIIILDNYDNEMDSWRGIVPDIKDIEGKIIS